jgi:LmbE family N-acetylglucosaminyl deacetylase
MTDNLKLMCLIAHPDDESLGMGATLAKYAAEGVEVSVISATRGERGWGRDEREYPGPEALGRIREGELLAAAEVLAVREVHFLDIMDGELDRVDQAEVVGKIVAHLRRIKPQVVVTFGPEGSYGHPDHIAICQLTHAGIVCAADQGYRPPEDVPNPGPAYTVPKLYYMADSKELIRDYEAIVGRMGMVVDGKMRFAAPWEDWAITTWIDVDAYVDNMWQAIVCHKSQSHEYEAFLEVSEAEKRRMFGLQSFYRVYSLVHTGRGVERDLFAGLR